VAIAFFSQEKGFTAAFEDVLDLNAALIHSTNALENRVLPTGRKNEDPLRLPENGYVWIVGHKDDLAGTFDRLQGSYNRLEHKGIIEVVFRLIDQEWSFALG
jgi:hypothetical protein